MKNFRFLCLFVMALTAVAIAFTSCDKELFTTEITFSGIHTDKSVLRFETANEKQNVMVTCGSEWEYSVSENWAKVSREANILSISVEANRNAEARSCELKVTKTDQSLSSVIKIYQETSLVTISSNVAELNFSSYEGAYQSLFLKANGEWQVYKYPDWVRPSVSKGNGSQNISFTTLSENKSANSRKGCVVFRTSDQELSITICQYGSAATDCKVLPNHITTLSNGIAFDMDYSQASNVAHYYRGYLEASRAGIMTTDEIINTLKYEFQRHLPADDEVVDFSGLKANTKYIIYTLAYNMDGKHGELLATEVTTNPAIANEPCAWITDLEYNSSYWYWTVTKSATCYSYYMMSTEDKDIANASDVLQAWWLEDAVRRNQITEYLNGGNWQMNRKGNMVAIWTRGVNSKGILAGKIDWNTLSANGSSRAIDANNKNLEGDHSGKKLKGNEYQLYLIK